MLEGFVKIPVLSGSSFMSVTRNGINFSGNVVFHLQRAEFVLFFLNSNEKQIAIQKCDDTDEDRVPFFREGANWKNGVRVNNRELQRIISRMMDWDLESYNYRADGIYSDKDNAMIFDLKTARKFNKRRKEQSNG